jgi:hypothetical protein
MSSWNFRAPNRCSSKAIPIATICVMRNTFAACTRELTIAHLFALQEMERADDGKHPQLAFAVYHLAEMVLDLKRHYHAAYKGKIEP